MSDHTLRVRLSPSFSEPGLSQVSQITVAIYFLLLSTFLDSWRRFAQQPARDSEIPPYSAASVVRFGRPASQVVAGSERIKSAVQFVSHTRYLPNRSTTGAFPDRKCAVSVPPSPSSGNRVHPPWPCRRGRGTCTEWREILPIRRCRLRAFSSGAGVSSTRLRSSQSHARRRRASSYNPEETTLPTSQRAPRPGRRTTRSIAREEWSKSAWTNL